jgi:hypothetical protein
VAVRTNLTALAWTVALALALLLGMADRASASKLMPYGGVDISGARTVSAALREAEAYWRFETTIECPSRVHVMLAYSPDDTLDGWTHDRRDSDALCRVWLNRKVLTTQFRGRNAKWRRAWIRCTVIHEFGHAMGFGHPDEDNAATAADDPMGVMGAYDRGRCATR